MAYILKKIGSKANIPCRTFECDDEADLVSIDTTGAPMGSRCYVINSGKWFALNSAGNWKSVPTGGGGGDTPSDPDPDAPSVDIIYDGGEET
jgi:hypothetical protein